MDVSVPTDRERVAWILVGLAITAVVVYVIAVFLGAIVVGLFLYYATRPAFRWLNDRLGRSRTSATITLLLVGVPILFVLGYAAFVGLSELDRFLTAQNLEELRSALQPYLGGATSLDRRGLVDLLQGNLSRVGSVVGMVATWLLRIFVVLTVAYYLLRYDRPIADWFRRSFEDHPAAVDFVESVDRDLQTLYTGNLLTIGATAAIAVVVFFGLNLLAPAGTGIGYPFLLGLLIGVATLVPAVGMKVVYVPYTAFLLWQTQTGNGSPLWFPVAFFVVTLVVVDLLPDTVVRSYVSSGHINMGLVMLAYVLGAATFGWFGIFFAPVVLVAFVHFARDVFPRLVGGERS